MSTKSQADDAIKAAIVPVSSPEEIEAGVRFRHAMKVELELPVHALRDDWAGLETAYFVRRTAEGGAQWYLARVGAEFIGSACAYIDDSWTSTLLVRPQSGWIIGVYVLPGYRRRGIARELTGAALTWLRATQCSEAKLHASPFGRGIYEAMGFALTNEMKLTL
jgi:GNAT superfamily N-acetyltransferase